MLFTFRNTKDLNSLKCLERQMLKQIDIIKTALNDVACEELPSGCDLSVEIENSNINGPTEQTVSLYFKISSF